VGWGALNVVVGEELTVYLSDVGKVSGPVALKGNEGKLEFKVNGKTGDQLFTLTLKHAGQRLFVQSDVPVQVTLDGRTQTTPANLEFGSGNLQLLEPVSKAKLRLVFRR